MEPSEPGTRPHAVRRQLTRLVMGATGGLVACTAAGFAGQLAWWLDLFVHFRVHGAVAGLLLVSAALALRARRTAALAGLCALAHLAFVATTFVPSDTVATRPVARALVFNVNSGGDPQAVAALLAENADVDVIGLLEITPRWVPALEDALAPWPYRVVEPRIDNFGLLLASRWPVAGRRRDAGAIGLPIIAATVSPPEAAPFGFVLVHPPPPVSARFSAARDAAIAAYPGLVDLPDDVIVAGDFNATPWAHALAPLDAAGYRWVAQGHGPRPTWPDGLGGMGLAIDHAFVKGALEPTGFEVLGSTGSDHRPIRFSVGRRR